MEDNVETFKKRWTEELTQHPERYFRNVKRGSVQAKDVQSKFAPDAAIQKWMDEGLDALGGICCLVRVHIPPIGGHICTVPPGGDPDNMCIQ